MSNNHALAAKVRAMYGRRLKSADYDTLMACHSVDEVARTLAQFPSYADIAPVLTEGTIHRGYLESALRRHYFDEFIRLYQYLSKNDKQLAKAVVVRYEITELLYCLQEGREHTGLINFRNEYIDRYSVLNFTALSRISSHKDLLEAVEGTPYAELLQPLLQEGRIRVLDAENVLYTYYYKQAVRDCSKLLSREQRGDLKQLIGMQLDFANISRIIRLRKYFGLEPRQIMPYLLTPYYRLDQSLLNRLMEEKEEAEWSRILAETPYGGLLDSAGHPNMGENMDELLKKAACKMIHFSANAATLVMAYLKMKDIELRNIVTLIETKRYGLSESEARTHLIGMDNHREEVG